jgi:hypothetical protein
LLKGLDFLAKNGYNKKQRNGIASTVPRLPLASGRPIGITKATYSLDLEVAFELL